MVLLSRHHKANCIHIDFFSTRHTQTSPIVFMASPILFRLFLLHKTCRCSSFLSFARTLFLSCLSSNLSSPSLLLVLSSLEAEEEEEACREQTLSTFTRLLHPSTTHRLYSFTAPCRIQTPPFCEYLVQSDIEQIRTFAPCRAQTPRFITLLVQVGCEHVGF